MINNGIPLWFRCFKGKNDSEAYKTSLIIEGISYVYDLFKNKNCNLIFLGDRFFENYEIMKYIDSIGETYCIRAKSNTIIYIQNYGEMLGKLSELKAKQYEEQLYNDVLITKKKYKTNIAISKSDTHKEAFYILTNGNVEKAVENYTYRFGSIEFIFKNQKSNGFYLESTKMRNIHAFTTLFGLMCIALLWLTILGVDYSINKNKFENHLQIRCYKKDRNSTSRAFSLFNTGLFYFNLAYNSNKKNIIKCTFILCNL